MRPRKFYRGRIAIHFNFYALYLPFVFLGKTQKLYAEVITMPDIFHSSDAFAQNPSMQQYFMSLPPYIQESIKQTGIDMKSEDELRKCAENLMKHK